MLYGLTYPRLGIAVRQPSRTASAPKKGGECHAIAHRERYFPTSEAVLGHVLRGARQARSPGKRRDKAKYLFKSVIPPEIEIEVVPVVAAVAVIVVVPVVVVITVAAAAEAFEIDVQFATFPIAVCVSSWEQR